MTGATPHVAVVTGGTGALGTAVTRAFLERGHAVVVPYRGEADAQRPREERPDDVIAGRLVLVRADVADVGQTEAVVRRTVETYDRLDHLANLAGGWSGGAPLWETTEEEWERMLSLNLRTAFAASRAALPQMIAQRYGRVVNVSSRAAVRPTAGSAAYAVSKMGVHRVPPGAGAHGAQPRLPGGGGGGAQAAGGEHARDVPRRRGSASPPLRAPPWC